MDQRVKRGETLSNLVICEIPEKIEQKVGKSAIATDEHSQDNTAVANTGEVVLIGPKVNGVKVGDNVKWLSSNAHPIRLFDDGEPKHVVMGEDEIVFIYRKSDIVVAVLTEGK